MSKVNYWSLLFFLIVFHWGIIALFAFEVIPQQTKIVNEPFLFHQGGDNYDYFSQTQAFARGDVIASRLPIGYSLMLVPALWIAPDATHDMLVQPMSFLWAVIMFPLSILLLAWITLQITGRRSLALCASALYVALPLIYLVVFNIIWNSYMAEIIAIHSVWAQMLSDGPAALLTLGVVALFLHARNKDYPWWLVVVTGLLLGFLTMVRLTGILVFSGMGLILLFDRKWIALALLIVGGTFGVLPQLIYSTYFFGNPFSSGYATLIRQPPYGNFNVIYLTEAITKVAEDLGLFVTISGLIAGVATLGAGLYALWQKNWRYCVLIGGWIIAYVVFYGVYYHSWRGAFMRFMIPIEAAISLVVVVLVAFVADKMRASDRSEGA